MSKELGDRINELAKDHLQTVKILNRLTKHVEQLTLRLNELEEENTNEM